MNIAENALSIFPNQPITAVAYPPMKVIVCTTIETTFDTEETKYVAYDVITSVIVDIKLGIPKYPNAVSIRSDTKKYSDDALDDNALTIGFAIPSVRACTKDAKKPVCTSPNIQVGVIIGSEIPVIG